MVLPRRIDEPSPLDPLILLPIPDTLPTSPQGDLDPLLTTLLSQIDAQTQHQDDRSAGTGPGAGKVPITALTASIRAINRKSQILLNAARGSVAQERDALDQSDSVLRGVEYERERVREEIERCKDYVPEYEALELPDAESFLSQAGESVLSSLPSQESDEYEQALMIARLESELEEITKREVLVAQLTQDRDALIKAKKEIKIKFDAVDVHLAGFTRSANAVASKLKDVADLPIPAPTSSSMQASSSTSEIPPSPLPASSPTA
ncbi:hypothetical protein I316_00289 [Kwoniella heveanensis BCC8398]|uniref:THO complex subunit 5 n=1 Tax=Kwoniella heveanensis BCC8398 TaxID=1296120 RepID=A0A1B9H468_9TREE|nr:hypothetical protein I316_00289 [Kwoniella heveanensis BCC8398]